MEVIVNNCVIARGEVVVVEGNYGIRIKQVISRQERLRTFIETGDARTLSHSARSLSVDRDE